MDTPVGTFFLIKHPEFDSFAIIHLEAGSPSVFPEGFRKLLPGNQDCYHAGIQVTCNDPYLDYLKEHWPEGFMGFETCEMQKIDEISYRLVTQYTMM